MKRRFTRKAAGAKRIGATWVLNAGRQPGDVPATITLDLAEGSAEYRNMEGCQKIDLGWSGPAPA